MAQTKGLLNTEIELKKLVLNTGQIEGLPANLRKTLIEESGLGEEVVDLLWGLLTVRLCDILSVVRNTCSIVSATWLEALGEGEFQPGVYAEGGVLL